MCPCRWPSWDRGETAPSRRGWPVNSVPRGGRIRLCASMLSRVDAEPLPPARAVSTPWERLRLPGFRFHPSQGATAGGPGRCWENPAGRVAAVKSPMSQPCRPWERDGFRLLHHRGRWRDPRRRFFPDSFSMSSTAAGRRRTVCVRRGTPPPPLSPASCPGSIAPPRCQVERASTRAPPPASRRRSCRCGLGRSLSPWSAAGRARSCGAPRSFRPFLWI